MNLGQTSCERPNRLLLFMCSIQFTVLIAVVLDVVIVRQVIGFLYLTFIPGITIMNLLKIDNLDTAESIAFSMGLSIAFLMCVGLLTNELGPLIGVSKPLSSINLTVVISSIVIFLLFILHYREREALFPLGITKPEPITLLVLLLPLLSITGVLLVNICPENNFLLLLMIMAIAGLTLLVLSKKTISRNLYSLLIISVAIALLFHSSLFSNHLNGWDIQHEYRFFKSTKLSSFWVSNIYDKFQPLLSVSVLPTVYSNILNIEGEWIYKIIYPIVFSFVPLLLYKLYHTWIDEKKAFLSTFFFMANQIFYTEMLSLSRQMVAELFYVLLIFTILNKKISYLNKSICFTLFGFALVVSHYAISYIFIFIIASTWFFLFFFKEKSRNITSRLVILYFAMSFSWYIYIGASGTFNELVSSLDYIFRSGFAEFFNIESRGSTVLMGLGMESLQSYVHLVGRFFAYVTEFFIVIGFIASMTKRKKTFSMEYNIILFFNMMILGMCVLLPYFAGRLGMSRFYHISLLFLAPLCIVGGETVFRLVSKNEVHNLRFVSVILVSYFLFQTGLVYEIAGVESWSIPLSKYRFDSTKYISQGLINEQDVFGLSWLSAHEGNGTEIIYSDSLTRSLLLTGGYGMFPSARTRDLESNTTEILTNGVVYLRWANIFYELMGMEASEWNTTKYISSTLLGLNKVYSCGGCEIYKRP